MIRQPGIFQVTLLDFYQRLIAFLVGINLVSECFYWCAERFLHRFSLYDQNTVRHNRYFLAGMGGADHIHLGRSDHEVQMEQTLIAARF